jgi:hypothetical protein
LKRKERLHLVTHEIGLIAVFVQVFTGTIGEMNHVRIASISGGSESNSKALCNPLSRLVASAVEQSLHLQTAQVRNCPIREYFRAATVRER